MIAPVLCPQCGVPVGRAPTLQCAITNHVPFRDRVIAYRAGATVAHVIACADAAIAGDLGAAMQVQAQLDSGVRA